MEWARASCSFSLSVIVNKICFSWCSWLSHTLNPPPLCYTHCNCELWWIYTFMSNLMKFLSSSGIASYDALQLWKTFFRWMLLGAHIQAADFFLLLRTFSFFWVVLMLLRALCSHTSSSHINIYTQNPCCWKRKNGFNSNLRLMKLNLNLHVWKKYFLRREGEDHAWFL